MPQGEQLELLDASGLVGREDFQNERYGAALDVMRSLAIARAKITPHLVVAHGKTNGNRLDDADLVWLTDCASTNQHDRAGLLQLAEELRVQSRARSTARALREQLAEIEAGRFQPGRTSGALDAISQKLARDFVPPSTADEDLQIINARWDDHAEHGTSELDPYGIRVMDEISGGGAPPKLIFIAGRPGSGKTALAASIIKAQLQLDEHVDFADQSTTGVFGLEDGTEWLSLRWLAEGIGMKLGEVGWKKLTPELQAKRDEVNQRLHPLLARVRTYKRESITPADLIRLATNWVFNPLPGRKKGVRRLVTDHLGELDLSNDRDVRAYWEKVLDAVTRARNFTNRYHVPWIFLVHDTEDANAPGKKEGPPKASALAGGRSLDRKARQIWGVWNKGGAWGEWRTTLLKNTGGPHGDTVVLERIYDAAMVTPTGGKKVDLEKEADEEQSKKDAVRDEKSSAKKAEDEKRREAKAAVKAARKKAEKEAEAAAKLAAKASPVPPAPPQAMLLDAPSVKPELPPIAAELPVTSPEPLELPPPAPGPELVPSVPEPPPAEPPDDTDDECPL